MKKVFAGVFCLLFCLFCLYGCDDPERQQQQDSVEQFIQNDEKLIEFVLSEESFPEGFLIPELEGYGRIIESSETAEEAQTTARELYSDEHYVAIVYDVRAETEAFFGLFVEWMSRDPRRTEHYTENIISFRKDVYDYDSQTIHTNDLSLIEGILSLNYYQHMYQTAGSKVIFSELTQTRNSFVYSIYFTEVVYGGYGIQDELSVYHDVLTINKKSKIMKRDSHQIRTLLCEVNPVYDYGDGGGESGRIMRQGI